MTVSLAAPLLCLLALVMAAVEIEIEGPFGWAEKLPTPYRVSGPLARLFGAALGGKPLTGYNLLMFPATLLAFHLPFAFGASWSAATELTVLASWVSWSALWDVLWFLLNPSYGWRRFRRGAVWWHRRWLWRLPLDYWTAAVVSLLLALAAGAAGASGALARQAVLMLAFVLFACASALAAPLYVRVYERTHAPGFDERHLVPIQPPPDGGVELRRSGGEGD